jgi:chemotaxis protein methyltransferase CheR
MSEERHDKEFLFNKRDFENVKRILYDMTGIRLADSKDSMVYSRLARRLRHLKLVTFAEYLTFLGINKSEEQNFVNALTTNLTSFFREKHHFPLLRTFLKNRPKKVRIWCAASSTGEEPYSIAMTVAETFGSFKTHVDIMASDIDSAVLEKASAGIYPLKSIEELNFQQRQQFFLRGKGLQKGNVRIVPELRSMVSFNQINLTHNNWAIEPGIDVIFCRNVMIYFDKKTQLDILARMVSLMVPDGLYIAGHSETFANAANIVTPIGKTVYRPYKGK